MTEIRDAVAAVTKLKWTFIRARVGPSLYERLYSKLEDLVTQPGLSENPGQDMQRFSDLGLFPSGISFVDGCTAVCQDMRLSPEEIDTILADVCGCPKRLETWPQELS